MLRTRGAKGAGSGKGWGGVPGHAQSREKVKVRPGRWCPLQERAGLHSEGRFQEGVEARGGTSVGLGARGEGMWLARFGLMGRETGASVEAKVAAQSVNFVFALTLREKYLRLMGDLELCRRK